jgi:hypothetical protein
MGYTPVWNATFAKPLLNQTIAIIQRDQQSAIDIVNSSLTPIVEFHKGPGARLAFPWLMVALGQTRFNVQSPWTRDERIRIALALDVGQFDQEMAQDNAADYAHVLDMVITSADSGNTTGVSSWDTALPIVHETVPGGTTTPPETGSVKMVWVDSHDFSLAPRPETDVPVVRVTLQLIFELQET